MKSTLFLSLLVSVLISLLLFTACPAETTPTPTPTPTPPASSPTPTPEAHWWDKLGEPQYGGTVTQPVTSFQSGFDTYNWMYSFNVLWYEPLWIPDWTLDPETRVFAHMWLPAEYWKGNLAEKWEWPDPATLVVHLRQDVYWQNKPPVNGRQFTADDVIWHFDRMRGTGHGFTKPNPFYAGRFENCQEISAPDKYTVVFKFKEPNFFINANSIIAEPILQFFEAPEVYEMGEPVASTEGINSALNDWQNQVGTGPFMLTDWVSGTSMTMSKNPDYWGYDERHPQNRLPYVDTVKLVCIPDQATQLAALRSGKVDLVNEIGWQQAQSLEKTNPELLKETYFAPGTLLQLRCDHEPFTDIRVRKALQLAVNLPEIAESYYGGTVDWKPVGMINPGYQGFATPYDEWPQELKDEYSYNPTEAKQLLADTGYPNGFATNVLCAPGGQADVELLQVLKSYFLDIGVDMEIEAVMDMPTLQNLIMAKKHDQMVAMGLSDDMPPQMGMRMFISIEPTNGLCQNDPVFDKMVDDVVHAGELDETQRLACETDMYWLQQHWVVTTFPLTKYVFWQPYLKGYSGQKPDAWYFTVLGRTRFWIEKD